MNGRWRRTRGILRFLLKYRHDLTAPRPHDVAAIDANLERARSFKADLTALGPAFIKIGQFLSTHESFLPAHWANVLETLQEDVEPFAFDAVRSTIEDELQGRLSKIFTTFDEVPIGSASLAQVHRAVLRDGRQVAVKVQRPGIAEDIHDSMRSLGSIARLVDARTRVGRRIRFGDSIADMRRTLEAELDFRLEAENLERLGKRMAAYPELFVPSPHWAFTSRRVLTMDLVVGVKPASLGLLRTEHDLGAVAQSLVKAYLDQAFVHGELHADPHPGNIRIVSDGRLAIFDFGMVAYIPPQRRMQLLKLLLAAVEGRGEDVAREAIAMGVRLDGFEPERYEREIVPLVARYAAHCEIGSLREGELVLDLSRISTACELRLPAELNLLGKALINVQHVCEVLQPEVDLKKIVEQHLQAIITGRLQRALSPASLATELLEVERLTRGLPRKLADTLSLVAENRVQVRVTGLQDSLLMENMQKIANRVAAGLIVSALLVSSALMMRVETQHTLFGYPLPAFVLFVVATVLGLGIVISALVRDRRAKPRQERGCY